MEEMKVWKNPCIEYRSNSVIFRSLMRALLAGLLCLDLMAIVIAVFIRLC